MAAVLPYVTMQGVFYRSSSEINVATFFLCTKKYLYHMGGGCGTVKVYDGQASLF
jgi:hypothetical protein